MSDKVEQSSASEEKPKKEWIEPKMQEVTVNSVAHPDKENNSDRPWFIRIII